MNLVNFLNKVDQITAASGIEQLRSFIHETARVLPESERQNYISRLENISRIFETKDDPFQDNDQDWQRQFKEMEYILHSLEEGEKYLLEEYNQEYDDWYNSSVEEILYHDPDHLCADIREVCRFIHKCTDEAHYQEGMKLGIMLFSLEVQTDNEYCSGPLSFVELNNLELIEIDMRTLALDTLYCIYYAETENRETRMYEIISQAQINNLGLEMLMQHGDQELEGFEDFRSRWIRYLGGQSGRLAERRLQEAVLLGDNVDAAFEEAKKYVKEHPGLYFRLFEIGAEQDVEKMLAIGQDGMNRIDPAYCIRSRVALATAEYALKLQRHDVAEECYLTAYESDTTAVNYLRALLNCADSEKRNQRLKKIPAFKPANMTAYYSLSSSSGELKKNILSDPMYYTLKFFQSSFIDVLHKGLNNKEALGWTGTFMKPGLALYMLLLYKGSKDIRGILQMVEIAREAVGFSREQYENGLMEKTSEKDASLFFKCFQSFKFFLHHLLEYHIPTPHFPALFDPLYRFLQLLHKRILRLFYAFLQIRTDIAQKLCHIFRYLFRIFSTCTQINASSSIFDLISRQFPDHTLLRIARRYFSRDSLQPYQCLSPGSSPAAAYSSPDPA